MSKQKFLNASAMAALCALAAFSLHAKAQGQASEQGMVVVRDAQTGKMRAPTPDELKALRAQSPAAMAPGAAPQQAPRALAPRRDGTRGMRLGDKHMVYEVVTRDADGKLNGECIQGDAAAAATLDAAGVQHKEHAHEDR
jgi:hypothetical protein